MRVSPILKFLNENKDHYVADVLPRDSAGTRYDLVYRANGASDAAAEEIVFKTQGFVTSTILPPITGPLRTFNVPETPKQSVEITGLGCRTFDRGVSGLSALLEAMIPYAGGRDKVLQSWNPQKAHFQSYPTISFSNRYFTQPEYTYGQDTVQLHHEVDPLKILTRHANSYGLVHLEDNEVVYFERGEAPKDTDERYRFRKLSPGFIQPGMMVEVQFGACLQKLNNGKFIFLVKLRSICVLNKDVIEDFNSITSSDLSTDIHIQNIKRKVGYDCSSRWSDSASEKCTDMDEEDEVEGEVYPVRQELKRLRLTDWLHQTDRLAKSDVTKGWTG
ncbi:hypothetical protein EIP91_011463 [Steccherinum ochraceum]|uniref:Uncharacterized protein n=1 Tax=Steccherinum ochraceum TaxID=92696 RepID=A0A4R0QZQ2_9APHY|nr:hypothetical protein EIP91_011463 [Steccherinum ochraceum]